MKPSLTQWAILHEALEGPFIPSRWQQRSVRILVFRRWLLRLGPTVYITDEGQRVVGMTPRARPTGRPALRLIQGGRAS